ncbi:hypothetical protein BC831DRAFT_553358 [Entophlyctis helioformis]|nr:hypothetical protein BC831DRAFT_553358 [Entophlyctis helioformis]
MHSTATTATTAVAQQCTTASGAADRWARPSKNPARSARRTEHLLTLSIDQLADLVHTLSLPSPSSSLPSSLPSPSPSLSMSSSRGMAVPRSLATVAQAPPADACTDADLLTAHTDTPGGLDSGSGSDADLDSFKSASTWTALDASADDGGDPDGGDFDGAFIQAELDAYGWSDDDDDISDEDDDDDSAMDFGDILDTYTVGQAGSAYGTDGSYDDQGVETDAGALLSLYRRLEDAGLSSDKAAVVQDLFARPGPSAEHRDLITQVLMHPSAGAGGGAHPQPRRPLPRPPRPAVYRLGRRLSVIFEASESSVSLHLMANADDDEDAGETQQQQQMCRPPASTEPSTFPRVSSTATAATAATAASAPPNGPRRHSLQAQDPATMSILARSGSDPHAAPQPQHVDPVSLSDTEAAVHNTWPSSNRSRRAKKPHAPHARAAAADNANANADTNASDSHAKAAKSSKRKAAKAALKQLLLRTAGAFEVRHKGARKTSADSGVSLSPTLPCSAPHRTPLDLPLYPVSPGHLPDESPAPQSLSAGMPPASLPVRPAKPVVAAVDSRRVYVS